MVFETIDGILSPSSVVPPSSCLLLMSMEVLFMYVFHVYAGLVFNTIFYF